MIPADCTCVDVPTALRARLEGRELAPCMVHDRDDAIDANITEATAEQTARLDLRAGADAVLAQIDELDQRRKARQADAARIEAIEDPLERALTAATYRSADLPLGLHPSSYPSLAGFEPDDAA